MRKTKPSNLLSCFTTSASCSLCLLVTYRRNLSLLIDYYICIVNTYFPFDELSMKTFLPLLLAISYSVLAQPMRKTAVAQLRMEIYVAQLDSVIGKDFRHYYKYDASGHLVDDFSFIWDVSQRKWVGNMRQEIRYVGDRITEELNYKWYDSKWIKEDKVEYINDSLHHRSQTRRTTWKIATQTLTSIWIDYYFYDSSDRLIRDSTGYWDAEEMKWINYVKSNYTYDGTGQLLEVEGYYWDKLWKKTGGEKYTYDAMGNTTSKTKYQVQLPSTLAVNDYREEYEYNSLNQNTRYRTFSRNTGSDTLVAGRNREYSYDKEGRKILTIEYKQKEGSTDWIPQYKNEDSLDGFGNIAVRAGSSWNSDKWEMSNKTEMEYDLSLSKELVNPPAIFQSSDYTSQHAVTFSNTYNVINGNWIKFSTTTYYYSQNLATSVPTPPSGSSAATLYPNPSHGDFTLGDVTSEGYFSISSLQGQALRQGRLHKGSNTIQTDLPKGIYLLEHNGKAMKFIVE